MVGADTYDRKWGQWLDDVAPDARPYVSRIEGGRLPYADASFDVVFANMVFEHIPWPDVPGVLREIRRVLRPGGRFIALFPTAEIWYEGHLGVYFAHWLSRWPRIQGMYLRACYRMGQGLHPGTAKTAAQWAEQRQGILQQSVFYHQATAVANQWAATFGDVPTSLAADYMRFRTGLGRRGVLLDGLLELACHKRACRVLLAAKSVEGSP